VDEAVDLPVGTRNLVTSHSLPLVARIGSAALQLFEKRKHPAEEAGAEQALDVDLLEEANWRTSEPNPEKKSSGAPTAEV